MVTAFEDAIKNALEEKLAPIDAQLSQLEERLASTTATLDRLQADTTLGSRTAALVSVSEFLRLSRLSQP